MPRLPSSSRTLVLLVYGMAIFSFVTVNVMLGYYVWMELRVFTVVLTGADRTATMPVYERSLYHSPDVSDEELQDHVREVALTELIDKIDDLGQTIRLLVGSGHSTEREVKPDSIALITPITSKGDHVEMEAMPLFAVSLSSLCETASEGYHYTYFLCYTRGDPLFGDSILVQHLFGQVKRKRAECSRWRSDLFKIDFVLVAAGPRVTGKRGLSILFNLPTLHAYAAGYEFFYLINDDLRFASARWTEVLTGELRRSTVVPHFGITGGLDISSPQHFAEFPFFHRLHVDIMGDEAPAHPYMFHNWWEDNWMTDTYIPWNASYYRRDVLIENYAGLPDPSEREGKTDGDGGSDEWPPLPTEPRRYEAKHYQPPPFYIREVERARANVRRWLSEHLTSVVHKSPEERGRLLGVELEYCRHANETLTLYLGQEVNPCHRGTKKPSWR